MKTLRPYQQAAIESLFAWFSTPDAGHPLVVAPVGSGKSLLIAEFIRRVHEMTPRVRIVCVTHSKELLQQNADELREQYPECDFGFYCAGLGQKRLTNDVTFASIQSIHSKVEAFNRAPQIILIDEVHLVSHNDETTYRRFIKSCIELNPDCKVIGLSGTPFRADTGRLDEGEGALFDGVAFQIEMAFMVNEGFWAKPITPKTETVLEVDGVGTRNGDYIAGQLEKAVDIDEKTKACVAEIVAHGKDRKKWLIFTAGLTHCEHVRDAIRAHGISCEMVTGETPKDERINILQRYKAGEIRCLTNVAVLTTGFNAPEIDLLAYMRPTQSPVLYVQTAGRGVRPVYADGFDLSTREGRLSAIEASVKKDVMILDFGNVINTLGPLDSVDIRKKEKREVSDDFKPIIKICPSCGAECAPAQRYCYSCSYQFPFAELDKKAARDAIIMSSDIEPETFDVWNMTLRHHHKEGKPHPVMRVIYTTNGGPFNEWVCFEHPANSLPHRKAISWHNERLPLFPMPKTVAEAVELPYPKPETVTVKQVGKYGEVIGVEFKDSMEPITPEGYAFQNAEEVNLDDTEIPF